MEKATTVFTAGNESTVEGGREWGRKAILAGWAITMLGVVGYCFAMMRVPQETGLLQALFTQGPLGWGSAILLMGGVATWLAGNFAFVREVVELPEHEADKEEL